MWKFLLIAKHHKHVFLLLLLPLELQAFSQCEKGFYHRSIMAFAASSARYGDRVEEANSSTKPMDAPPCSPTRAAFNMQQEVEKWLFYHFYDPPHISLFTRAPNTTREARVRNILSCTVQLASSVWLCCKISDREQRSLSLSWRSMAIRDLACTPNRKSTRAHSPRFACSPHLHLCSCFTEREA